MVIGPRTRIGLFALGAGLIAALTTAAPNVDPGLFSDMRWRCIGPFRAGRTVAAVGIPKQPNVFFVGVNNGGVWKTTDAGRTWAPIFDDQPTGSIGAMAIAPSDPNVIYVGSGEGLQRPDLSVGDGIYKSTDGGKTWRHLGLRDGQQIGALLVDPKDPNRVFAAVLGHPYGANAERGVFRSTDGGESWQKVLYKDENTGAIALAFDPTDARVIYADLWAARQAPWEVGASFQGPGSGLFKSTDGGSTWKRLENGLPTIEQGLGRIGIAVAPSDPNRLYAQVDADRAHAGTYRSDDAGSSWRRVNSEERVWGRGGDFAEVKVDPKNPDVVYAANTSTYRSTDGGRTWTAIKGAPGGDDYHTIWINPDNPDIILLAADQGATISVNGGKTWSSWYNQPTAQFYHVVTDNQFPYRVYGGQQESGSAWVLSRSDDGSIHFGNFHPAGVEEYGYIAPDPLDPNIVYGGKISRTDLRTGDVQNISPSPIAGKYRFVRTMPVLFSPVDPHLLFFAGNVLFATRDGGRAWKVISPDLTRETWEMPASVGIFAAGDPEKGKHRGVIYAVAPSPKDVNLIWAGTDDGLIHVTADGGKTWKNVTPKALTPWSKVSMLEASHSDPKTAYAAINRFRLDDLHPHIWRTRDGGASWQEIVRGIPDNEVVNTVKEDPGKKGLLFAGTERTVYVSFDDGDEWQPIRLNLPATSIRDLVVHGDDVVIGTHGRSFWILDDITPLRQWNAQVAAAAFHLFQPQTAIRVRRSQWPDTPLPPEEPAGQNPPDGAILDYVLKARPSGPVILVITDSAGRVVRRFSSADEPVEVRPEELTVETRWLRPPRRLSAEPGMHRFVWDLHGPNPDVLEHEMPISAVPGDTPRGPLGPTAPPGTYGVALTVDGRTLTARLTVQMDPRVTTPAAGLAEKHRIATALADAMGRDFAALAEVRNARTKLAERRKANPGDDTLSNLDAELAALEGASAGRRRGNTETLAGLNGKLAGLYAVIEGSDRAPTPQAIAAWGELDEALGKALDRWKELSAAISRTPR